MRILILTALACLWAFSKTGAAVPDYSVIDAILSRHCLDCHEAKDPEGKLVLEDFESLMKGGESGAAIVNAIRKLMGFCSRATDCTAGVATSPPRGDTLKLSSSYSK